MSDKEKMVEVPEDVWNKSVDQLISNGKLLAEANKELTKYRQNRIHDLNQIGGLQEDIARLTEAVEYVTRAFEAFDTSILQTPIWVRQAALRDAVKKASDIAKELK